MAPKKKQKKMSKAERGRIIARTTVLTPFTAVVTLPRNSMLQDRPAGATSERFPFFASGLKSVCASSEVKPTCYGKRNAKLTKKSFGLTRPTDAEYAAACKRAGGKMKAGYPKPIRPDKVDIAFLSPAQAKKLQTQPGPNLRLCLRDDEKGYLVPVTTPEQAQKLQRDFGKCTKKRKSRMPFCALKIASRIVRNPPLGGFFSR